MEDAVHQQGHTRFVLWIRVDNAGLLPRGWSGASLVVQWWRVCLPMQGMRVRALVWEDPICHGATGPVSHNY